MRRIQQTTASARLKRLFMSNTPQNAEGDNTFITVLQHNVHRSKVPHHTLLHDAFLCNATLVFIQEPYVFNVNGLIETLSHPSYYVLYPFVSLGLMKGLE